MECPPWRRRARQRALRHEAGGDRPWAGDQPQRWDGVQDPQPGWPDRPVRFPRQRPPQHQGLRRSAMASVTSFIRNMPASSLQAYFHHTGIELPTEVDWEAPEPDRKSVV